MEQKTRTIPQETKDRIAQGTSKAMKEAWQLRSEYAAVMGMKPSEVRVKDARDWQNR